MVSSEANWSTSRRVTMSLNDSGPGAGADDDELEAVEAEPVEDELRQLGAHLVWGPIGEGSLRPVVAAVVAAALRAGSSGKPSGVPPLTLLINSSGGSLHEALALI